MAYRENTVPRLLLLRQGVVVRPKKDTPPVVSCEQDSQNTKCIQVSIITPSRCNQTSHFPFHFSLINYSSAATSAFPPQQGMDTTICPRELGLCRIYHFALIAFLNCESHKSLCRVLRFLHCYGNTVLGSYWNIQPTSIQHQNSQVPAEYLSKERFSNASLVLAYNKEKRRLFSSNSSRILQTLKLLWRPALNSSASPSLEKFMKGQDPGGRKRQKETPTSRITQTAVIQMWLNVCGQYPAN